MEFKGYIATSGNYITVAEQKKRYTKFKKERQETQEERKTELERKENLAYAEIRQQKIDEQKAIEQEQLFVAQAKQFVSYAAKTLPYSEYLVAWDIVNRNRMQIEYDINREKITLEQVKKVFILAQNYIDNLTDKIYMNDLFSIYDN